MPKRIFMTLFTSIAVSLLALAACTVPAPPAVGGGTVTDITEVEPALPDVTDAGGPSTGGPSAELSGAGVPFSGGELITDSPEPPFSTASWSTDFSRRTIEWSEVLSGGPPKDGIPAIDSPTFESQVAGNEWLDDREPVVLFQHGDVARAYPLSILIWHEIVNDEVAGLPVSITFCPLCNASIAFDRRFDGQVLDFGTTGKLRNSDLIMYDRQTETWWQQFTGEGVVGQHAGEQLVFLSSQVISWGDFKERFSEGEVLARPQRNGNFARSYGRNPYVGYDQTSQPFLFRGAPDPRLPATSRIVGLTTEETARAYPRAEIAEAGAINDEFEGTPLVVLHKEGTASALDAARINEGRDVGAVAVFDRRLGDQTLTFSARDDGLFVDDETGSTWNILGEAVDGPLAGQRLTELLHFDHFWFAWAAFFPETSIYAR